VGAGRENSGCRGELVSTGTGGCWHGCCSGQRLARGLGPVPKWGGLNSVKQNNGSGPHCCNLPGPGSLFNTHRISQLIQMFQL
jgi:hypothetical protein